MNKFTLVVCILILGMGTACENIPGKTSGKKLDPLPYYDVSGLINQELDKLADEKVHKTVRINGKETQTVTQLSPEEWREELGVFFKADINLPSHISSYTTEVNRDILLHRLKPDAKGAVKEIQVRIVNDQAAWLTFKISKESYFYTSYVLGELYFNRRTNKIDHYSIETTQKIWFLKANNLRIKGALKP